MVSFMYFDVGGVVINDFSATNHWEGLKHELGVTTDEQSQQFETFWEKYADSVCTTQDVDDLLPALTDELNLTFPAGYSLLAAFVRRFSTNEDIWPIVEEVQRTHKTGLLTNMYPRMFKKIEDAALLPTGAKWDALIDSSDIGHAKPSKEIYDISQKEAGCAAEDILFIDNTFGHLKAAEELGWQTFFYDSADTKKSSADLLSFLKSL